MLDKHDDTMDKQNNTLDEQDETQNLLDRLDDKMDSLAITELLLLDDLLQNKQLLAEWLRQGFFSLGKARYSLGGHAVSALRLPDSGVTAILRTETTEEVVDEPIDGSSESVTEGGVDSLINTYRCRKVVTVGRDGDGGGQQILKKRVKKKTDGDDCEELTREVKSISLQCGSKVEDIANLDLINNSETDEKKETEVEEKQPQQQNGEEEKDEDEKPANKDPMTWFSALPPQSLRQAQGSFRSCTSLAASCVSQQARLQRLRQNYVALAAQRRHAATLRAH